MTLWSYTSFNFFKTNSILIEFLIIIENKDRRMRMQSQSLIRQAPSEQERLVIHEQFLRTVSRFYRYSLTQL